MTRSALSTLQQFRTAAMSGGGNGGDIDFLADDSIYFDPFAGVSRGRAEIEAFVRLRDDRVRVLGATFANWHVDADQNCGWAEWDFVLPSAGGGAPVAIQGSSLYRLRDGLVTFAADLLDSAAFERQRPSHMESPDLTTVVGLSDAPDNPAGPAHDVLAQYWELQDEGRFSELADLFTDDALFISPNRGMFSGRVEIAAFLTEMETLMPGRRAQCELVDLAGDESSGWTQWWLHLPDGSAAGWTLFTLRDGRITYARDVVDLAKVHPLLTSAAG